MVPRNPNHPWRIRLIVMAILIASVGLVEAIQASVTGTAASAVHGAPVVATRNFNTDSSMLNTAQIAIDSGGQAGQITNRAEPGGIAIRAF